MDKVEKSKETVILYEAPHKIMSTLKDLEQILEDRQIVLARELTKLHEEFIRGNAREIIEKAENLKGEIVLIIEANKKVDINTSFETMSLEEHYKLYEKQGLEKKEIIKRIAKDRNLSRNEIYQKFLST